MADFSFDVVSKVELQEVDNAIQQAMKEILQRYDFRGSKSSIALDKGKNEITIVSDDEFRMKAVVDLLQGRFVKRSVPLKNIDWGSCEPAGGNTVRQLVKIKQGIEQEKAKEIAKAIRDTKIKVQPQIQGDQLRVSGKSKDALQEVIVFIKGQDFGVGLQFTNYR
jgi:hypothetical protein